MGYVSSNDLLSKMIFLKRCKIITGAVLLSTNLLGSFLGGAEILGAFFEVRK